MKDYSNYHNIDTKTKMVSDGKRILKHALERGYESEDVIVDGKSTKAIIQSKYSDKDGDSRNIITESGTIVRGSLVAKQNTNWLVTGIPTNNNIYEKAIIQLCNANITIKSIPLSPPIIGYDDFMNPIYPDDYDPTPQEIPFPAIVEKTVVNEDTGAKIALDEDKIKATISYVDLTIESFWVYGEKFDVYSKDQTKVIDDKGLLILFGERSKNG
ncbi:MAG: hypothetical protein ACI35O_02430 [Bacillaceae bacterium]